MAETIRHELYETKCHTWRDCLKKCVLSWDLNWERVGRAFMLAGSVFHTSGAMCEKDLPPTVFRLGLFGGWSLFTPDERTTRGVSLVTRVSLKYFGKEPWKWRKASVAILNWQRYFTGSQWSSVRRGVTWSRILFWRTTRAAWFCTLW